MLKNLKKRFEQEEEAFTLLKNTYPLIAHKSNEEILSYFELERSEIVSFSKTFKHLSEERNNNHSEPNTVCLCTDVKGQAKNLYETREEAEKRHSFLKTSQNLTLTIYPCPHTRGWHLSKR